MPVEIYKEEVESAKESRELGLAGEYLFGSVLDAVADGKVTLDEVLQSITGSVQKLMDAAKGAEKVGPEHSEDLNRATNAWVMTGLRMKEKAMAFAKAKEAAAAPAPVEGEDSGS